MAPPLPDPAIGDRIDLPYETPEAARVIGAGVSRDGRPYFVMELVDGVPVTTFCDEHQIPLGGRLTLFLAICQGGSTRVSGASSTAI
jgi:hypothetical protein